MTNGAETTELRKPWQGRAMAGYALAILLTLAALCLRFSLFYKFIEWDTRAFLRYINRMSTLPFAEAMREHFTKLSSAYLYLWYPIAFFPTNYHLVMYKSCTVAFDLICALWVWQIVRLRTGNRSWQPVVAALLILFLPVTIMNSSLWGQIDSVYTSFLLGAVFFLLRMHTPLACRRDRSLVILCLSVAFCFKLQTTLFLPALAFFLGRGTLPWITILCPPLLYLVTLLPRIAVGYPAIQLFRGYQEQVSLFYSFSERALNPYLFLRNGPLKESQIVLWIGISIAGAGCLLALFAGYRSRRWSIDPSLALCICLLGLTFAPFVLPKMHERYFYAANLLSVPLCFYWPRTWLLAVTLNTISAYSYLPRVAIAQHSVVPLGWCVPLMAAIVAWLAWKTRKELRSALPKKR